MAKKKTGPKVKSVSGIRSTSGGPAEAKKKTGPKVKSVSEERDTKPIRLDLSLADHERIERSAKRFGLSKSAYVRVALFEKLEDDEGMG